MLPPFERYTVLLSILGIWFRGASVCIARLCQQIRGSGTRAYYRGSDHIDGGCSGDAGCLVFLFLVVLVFRLSLVVARFCEGL